MQLKDKTFVMLDALQSTTQKILQDEAMFRELEDLNHAVMKNPGVAAMEWEDRGMLRSMSKDEVSQLYAVIGPMCEFWQGRNYIETDFHEKHMKLMHILTDLYDVLDDILEQDRISRASGIEDVSKWMEMVYMTVRSQGDDADEDDGS